MEIVVVIAVAALVATALFIFFRYEKRKNEDRALREAELTASGKARADEKAREKYRDFMSDRLIDDNLIMHMTAFENDIDNFPDAPDAILRHEAYVYRQLMKKWYASLVAKHRYDDTLNQIKDDMLTYLAYKRVCASQVCLSVDYSLPKEKREEYGDAAWATRQKLVLIEDGFASAVGPEAVAELKAYRNTEVRRFDRLGKLPIAPEGHKYVIASAFPVREKVVPDDGSEL